MCISAAVRATDRSDEQKRTSRGSPRQYLSLECAPTAASLFSLSSSSSSLPLVLATYASEAALLQQLLERDRRCVRVRSVRRKVLVLRVRRRNELARHFGEALGARVLVALVEALRAVGRQVVFNAPLRAFCGMRQVLLLPPPPRHITIIIEREVGLVGV